MRMHSGRSTAIAFAFALLLAPAPNTGESWGAARQAAAQQARIPASISDAEYWRMITELSEPDGTFHSENFVSNEGTFQRLLPELKTIVAPGGVYLGVGPEQNFSYITTLRPRIAFIVDIRRQNMILHLMYKAVFEQSPTRADFLMRLYSRPKPEGLASDADTKDLFARYQAAAARPELFGAHMQQALNVLVTQHGFRLTPQDSATLRHVYEMFYRAGPEIRYSTSLDGAAPSNYVTMAQTMTTPDGEGINRSFLGSEENYRVVREMHRSNLIVPVVGDFAGPTALRAVGEYLRARDATVSAFYVSNVESYLFADNATARRFYNNVATMPLDAKAIFIRPASGTMSTTTIARPSYSTVDSLSLRIDPTGGTQILRTANGGYIVLDRAAFALPAARTVVNVTPASDNSFSNITATLKAVADGSIARYSDVFRIPR